MEPFARSGLPAVSRKKNFPESHGWILASFLFCEFIDLNFVLVHKHAKKNLANIQPSWPYTWSITHISKYLCQWLIPPAPPVFLFLPCVKECPLFYFKMTQDMKIGHSSYINILTLLWGFWDKLLHLVLFSLYPSHFNLEFERQKKLKNLQFWPESLWAIYM